MKSARELISIIVSFALGSIIFTFLSYIQKNLIAIPHEPIGYVVPVLAGGFIGGILYTLSLNVARLSAHNQALSGSEKLRDDAPTPSRIQLIIYILLGMALLALFSTIQKSFAGYPIQFKAYIVPLFFGGISGLFIGELLIRNQILLKLERQAVVYWQQEKDKTLNILTSLSNGLLVTDASGRIELINEPAQQILELDSDAIKGQSLAAIFSRATGNDYSHTFIPSKVGETFQDTIVTKDGSTRTIKGSTSAVQSGHTKTGAIIVLLRDNTEEQRIERMKSEFISAATHNLKTPITTITGYSELLLSRNQIDKEQQQEFLTQINDKAWQLDKLITSLVDINHVDSGGEVQLIKEPFPASLLFDSARKFCATQQSRCDLRFNINDSNSLLFIDLSKMELVLENLLSNAFKFSPEGGLIRVSGELNDLRYAITIADEGIGMSHENCQRIFDKFYRIDGSYGGQRGIGLGLTLAKKLVEAHGGEIHADSTLGKGTTLSFSLPVRNVS
ncbi:MAG: PAS domain-containing protein [Deltaproteobacteria bacterium]|nr:PAS domain-containing protein [Deltaproteobacteria bacterium]